MKTTSRHSGIRKPKLKKSKNKSPKSSLLPKRELGRALNKMLGRREAVKLRRPCRPLATPVAMPPRSKMEDGGRGVLPPVPPQGEGVSLVMLDVKFAMPFVVKWTDPGGLKLVQEQAVATKLEADFLLTVHRNHKPELWVKARQA